MGKLVLVVEDNEDNRTIITTILQHFGYETKTAVDGEEALRKTAAEKPDLILLDISIPKIDGWVVAERLRADPATKDIPILVLSAHAGDADRRRASAMGLDGYLVKPIEPVKIVEAVKRFVPLEQV